MKVFRETFEDINDINMFLEKNTQYKCFNIETITNCFGATNYFVAWLTKEQISDAAYRDIIAEESNTSYESDLENGRREMIDKACAWLYEWNKKQALVWENAERPRISDYTMNVSEFRKAMEE